MRACWWALIPGPGLLVEETEKQPGEDMGGKKGLRSQGSRASRAVSTHIWVQSPPACATWLRQPRTLTSLEKESPSFAHPVWVVDAGLRRAGAARMCGGCGRASGTARGPTTASGPCLSYFLLTPLVREVCLPLASGPVDTQHPVLDR